MDCYAKSVRSKTMSRVHSKNTTPELLVRKTLYHGGLRYRLHDSALPGKPDLVLAKYKTVVFVNGCFWHRHPGCKHASTPASNFEYWQKKFQGNVARDAEEIHQLECAGWNVVVIWECELKKTGFLKSLPDRVRNNHLGQTART